MKQQLRSGRCDAEVGIKDHYLAILRKADIKPGDTAKALRSGALADLHSQFFDLFRHGSGGIYEAAGLFARRGKKLLGAAKTARSGFTNSQPDTPAAVDIQPLFGEH